MKTGDKTQPQELLEEIVPKDLPRNEDEKYPSMPEIQPLEPKFPSLEAQQQHWVDKEVSADTMAKVDAELKLPRKWSLARRRKFNKTMAKKKANLAEHPMYDYPPTDEQLAATDTKRLPPEPLFPLQVEDEEGTMRFCPCCGKNIERFLS